MDDSLRSNVAETTSCHLTVLGDALRVHLFIHLSAAVIGDDHSVADDYPRRIRVRREKAQRMATVENQCLFFSHLAEILHDEMVLRPVAENSPIPTISNELLGKLSHSIREVVHNHQDNSGSLLALGRVNLNRVGFDGIVSRTKSAVIDVTISPQLLGKLRRELGMVLFREVTETAEEEA